MVYKQNNIRACEVFFSFAPHSMWDFSSPARYWTRPLAMRVQSPNHQGTLYRGLNIYISLAIYSRTFSVKFNLVFNILFKSNLLHKPSLVLPDLWQVTTCQNAIFSLIPQYLVHIISRSRNANFILNTRLSATVSSDVFVSGCGWVHAVTDFIFLGSKITADGDYSHEIRRGLILGRKAMSNLDSILKNRDIILPTKVHIVTAMVFPAVMYGCESWTIMKAEC